MNKKMKKKYTKPELLILNITIRDGILQTMSFAGEGTKDPDEEEIGAREENNMGDIFNNSHSIWDNAW